MVLSTLYGFLDLTFGWMFRLTANTKTDMLIGIFGVSLLISLFINAITLKVVDQKDMKEKKKKLKEYQEKFNEATKAKDTKKLQKAQREMLELQAEFSKHAMKPMMYYMPLILLIFAWLRNFQPLQSYIAANAGFIIQLPFSFPLSISKFLQMGRPDALGWLGWYLLCSFMTSTVIRKILKIHM